jgi:hypothetical protein
MDEVSPTVTAIELAQLGERLSALRLRPPEALREMERSLARHGQLVAVVCHRQDDKVEVVDGFKRLIGARALGWPALRAEIHEVSGPAAKLCCGRATRGRRCRISRRRGWSAHCTATIG